MLAFNQDGLEHDLLQMFVGLLRALLKRDWFQQLGRQHVHRKTMVDLTSMDPVMCKLDHRRLSSLYRSRLSAIQSGAFWTAHVHAKFDVTKEAFCLQCGQKDDVRHRLHECPRFERNSVRCLLDCACACQV